MAISLVGSARPEPPERGENGDEATSHVPGLLGFLATLHEPVFEFDDAGRCHYMNPAFRELLGLAETSPVAKVRRGTVFPEWLREDEYARWSFFVDVHRSGQAAELGIGPTPFSLKRIDGSEVACRITGQRLLSRTGVVLGLVAVVSPVTAAKQATGDISQLSSEMHRLSSVVQQLVGGDAGVPAARPFPFVERRASVKTVPDAPIAAVRDLVAVPDADPSTPSRLDSLSDRERDILRGLLEGKRTATMARELFLSEHTIRNHLKHIYRKVGVHSLGELREVVMPIADGLTKRDAKRR